VSVGDGNGDEALPGNNGPEVKASPFCFVKHSASINSVAQADKRPNMKWRENLMMDSAMSQLFIENFRRDRALRGERK